MYVRKGSAGQVGGAGTESEALRVPDILPAHLGYRLSYALL